jgi:pyridoxine 5-phosphate synthase
MTCKLSVNLNAVAMLRNRRDLPWPSVTDLGRTALEAGAYGLTVHPRPDERHIRKTDVFEVREMMRRGFMDKEFNIEGYPDDRFMAIVEEVMPTQVTLVPDDPLQDTSDHGWDFAANMELLKDVSARLRKKGMRVAMFADADASTITLAKEAGADRVELYTGPYGATYNDPEKQAVEMEKLVSAGMMATQAGLGLNAGHDLTLDNLPQLIMGMPFLDEVSIGHCITADALKYGMAGAVERYRAACGDSVKVRGGQK